MGPYNSLNLGYTTSDYKQKVLKNRIKFLEALNADVFGGIQAGQVHGSEIKIVRSKISESGILVPGDCLSDTDGLITDKIGLLLAGTFADCVPLYFYDPEKKVVAITHAGWKGTKENIASKTVKILSKEKESKLENIKVIIGPSIGRCCYEVGDEVYEEFKAFDFYNEIFSKGGKKYKLDLWLTNKIQLEQAGIRPENVLVSEICSGCYNDFLFSYRKEKGETGRMMGAIMLNSEKNAF